MQGNTKYKRKYTTYLKIQDIKEYKICKNTNYKKKIQNIQNNREYKIKYKMYKQIRNIQKCKIYKECKKYKIIK